MIIHFARRSSLILLVDFCAFSRKNSLGVFVQKEFGKYSSIASNSVSRGVIKGLDQKALSVLGGLVLKTRNMSSSDKLHSTARNDTEMDDKKSKPSDFKTSTHYIFLVHGWLGNDLEMRYLETAIALAKDDAQSFNADKRRLVIHRSTCNNGQTTDGIINGGTRLTKEIVEFILRDTDEQIKCNEPNSPSEKH